MTEPTRPARSKNTIIYVVVAFVLLLIAMYAWKEVALVLQDRADTKEREALAANYEEMEQQLQQTIAQRARETMKLLGVPLGWAVRTEAIQQDYAQIEDYMLQLVKQPGVDRVVFVASDGNVRISTDKKLQGEPAAPFYGNLANSAAIALKDGGLESPSHLAVPILGYNERLGCLIVTFSRAAAPAVGP